ncbi:imm11 family protein [Paenibacillus sp. GCM10023252]|uniref:imm11 family protein n=1 Tax=Paenibacillus sp. GCM10023252 TaxID=3252649 RepID=UPI003619C2C0
MKIWQLRPIEKCMELDFNLLEDYQNDFQGVPIHHSYENRISLVKKGRHNEIAYLTAGIPVFNLKAFDVVSDLIKDDVQFLPTTVEGNEFVLVNVLSLINCLDYTKSVVEKNNRLGFVDGISEIYFLEAYIRDKNIFKIPEFPKTRVYVTDTFKEAVEASKLKGFEFSKVWDSEISKEVDLGQLMRYHTKIISMEHRAGGRYSWGDILKMMQEDRAFASERWKVQTGKYTQNILAAQLGLNGEYYWVNSTCIPDSFSSLLWYEVDKEDI